MKNISLFQTKIIYHYDTVLEGLVEDFGYAYWHSILEWCQIIGKESDEDSNKYWQVYLICNENKEIGICGLYSLKKFNNKELWLGWFGIIPEHRSKKIGEKVLELLEDKAKNEGCQSLYSYVEKKNFKAMKFYKRNGFKRICSVKQYLSKFKEYDRGDFESLNDHVIRKELK